MQEARWSQTVPHAARTAAGAVRLRTLLWIGLLALVPRLIIALVLFNYPIALDDMFQYDMLARSIASGQGYRWYTPADVETLRPYLQQVLDLSQFHPPANGLVTTFRPPGYPAFLASIYLFTPSALRFGLVRLAQALLMALLAPATALLALRIGASRRGALLAGVGMACYPILWLYPAALASEDLFIPLIAASMLLLLRAARKPSSWQALPAGLALGAAMLTRSVVALFTVLAAAWLWKYGRARWKAALVLLVTAFGLCLPWAIRNTLVSGRPAFVETALGFQLYVGYHPLGDGGFISQIAIPQMRIIDDGERDRLSLQAALGFIRADPAGAALRVLRRAGFFVAVEDRELLYFYTNSFFGEVPQALLWPAYLAFILPWLAVCALAVPGLALAPNRPAAWLALALIGGYILPHLLIIAEPRFHLALVPVLLPFAALAWEGRGSRGELARLVFAQKGRAAWLVRAALGVLLILWAWSTLYHLDRVLTALEPGGSHARFYY